MRRHMRRAGRQAVSHLFGTSLEDVDESVLGGAEVVSFDVFDTLVLRNCSRPEVVFDLVERRYNRLHPLGMVQGFREARIDAERRAREIVSGEEPTVYEIYAVLEDGLRESAPELLSIELETELGICRANPRAKELYDRALSMGRRVVIASDMYLGADVIAKILARCGYFGYERLYVSADAGMTKRSGGLFGLMLRDLGVSADKILHVGDHPMSDWLIPKKHGIASHLYRRRGTREALFARRFGYAGEPTANDVLASVVANGAEAHGGDVREWMGYCVLGPMLYGYASWLREVWLGEGRPHVLFLSREGDILKKAWDALYGDGEGARYVNVSRIALCRAVAGEARGYDELFVVFSCLTNGCRTVGDFLDILGLPSDGGLLSEHGITSETPFGPPVGEALYDFVADVGGGAFAERHGLLVEYLGQMVGSDGRDGDISTALVCDIGWAGTMQALLQRLLTPGRLVGAYLAVSDFHDGESGLLNRSALDRRGFWCGSGRWPSDGQIIRFAQSAMETLFLNGEGTTVGYEHSDSGVVVPVKETSGYLVETEESAAMLHDAALRFVMDCAGLRETLGEVSRESAMLPFINTVVRPTARALEFYSHFRFVDGVRIISLLPEHGLPYYVIHPKRALREFNLSNSKIIWLKGLLKLPLPYYRFLRFLTSGIGLKSDYARSVEGEEAKK